MSLSIREAVSASDARAIFPIMRELRSHLDEAEYLRRWEVARKENHFTLVGIFEKSASGEERCLGAMGYRLQTDFCHGRQIYVDDLVTTEAARSRGIGARLLAHAEKIAQDLGCDCLRLCTGVDNKLAMKFYEREGWQQRSVAYKKLVE